MTGTPAIPIFVSASRHSNAYSDLFPEEGLAVTLREVICFDIGSGGMSAVRFNERLEIRDYAEIPWTLPLSADSLLQAFHGLNSPSERESPVAISISSFMHSFLVTDANG